MFGPNTLLLIAALAAPPGSVARAPTANDSILASVVAPLIQPGSRLRVRTTFAVVDGAAGAVDPLGVRLRREPADIWSQPHTEALTWSQIERIDQHTPHAGNAAKIGATIGCLLGLAMIASAYAYATEYGDTGVGAGGVLFGFVVGGVAGGCAGGLAGGIVGSFLPAWKTVYERR